MTSAGFTGLGLTPNAHIVPWGRLDLAYENQLPGVVRDPVGHNFVAGFGLLPNLEIAGRIAADDLQCNGFTQKNCGGARDLSAAAKIGIGLDSGNKFHIAAGAADFGGAVTYFRTYYGVLSYNEGPIEVSAGLAKRSGRGINGSKSPLNGPFGGLAWQPMPLVRGHIEYTDGNAWGGVRLYAPGQWLPAGWQASVGVNQRLTSTNLTAKSWWSLGLSIPLYKVPELGTGAAKAPLPVLAAGQYAQPTYEARNLLAAPPPAAAAPASPGLGVVTAPTNVPAPVIASKAAPSSAVRDSDLQQLAAALKARGLEDISVGRMPDGSVAILANNAAYKWNSLDALGTALGTVSRTLGHAEIAYRLVLTQRQIPLVAITGQANCLKQWINNQGQLCTAGELLTPGGGPLEPLYAGAAWVVRDLAPSWQTLRVTISPVLRTNVATEVGVLDASLGVNASVALPLWKGADVEWSRNIALNNSNDYETGGVFANRQVRSATERLALTQTVRVPLEKWLAGVNETEASRFGMGGLTAQGTVGRVGGNFDGALGALRWEPGYGLHRFTGQAGIFKNNDYKKPGTLLAGLETAKPVLLGYRYAVMPTRTYLEATGGQFMNNDRGVQFGLRQWFSDVAVNVYYKRTSFGNSAARSFVGLEMSVPIGPRQDPVYFDRVQVGGPQRFAHAIETVVGQSNAVSPGYGALPPVPTIDAVFNSDRASLAYFEDNIQRIRDAAR
jgi:hypothetical protein